MLGGGAREKCLPFDCIGQFPSEFHFLFFGQVSPAITEKGDGRGRLWSLAVLLTEVKACLLQLLLNGGHFLAGCGRAFS